MKKIPKLNLRDRPFLKNNQLIHHVPVINQDQKRIRLLLDFFLFLYHL